MHLLNTALNKLSYRRWLILLLGIFFLGCASLRPVAAEEVFHLSFCEGTTCTVKEYHASNQNAAQNKCIGELVKAGYTIDGDVMCEPVAPGSSPNCGKTCQPKEYSFSCCFKVTSELEHRACVSKGKIQAASKKDAEEIVRKKMAGWPAADECFLDDNCGGIDCDKKYNPDAKPKPEPDKIPITDPGAVGHILSSMNPLGSAKICSDGNLTIGCILSYIVNNIIFPLSTIFLLLMIIWGGYKIVSGSMAGAQNAVQAGKQRLIGAILGFILLASVYWIWQLIEATTKIHIMNKWW